MLIFGSCCGIAVRWNNFSSCNVDYTRATAYLLTDKFDNMTIISVLSAIISSLIGIYISFWFDLETGGSIVLAQTFIFLFAFLFAPRYGIFKLKKFFAGYK